MKLHERTMLVQAAKVEIDHMLLTLREKHGLTPVEYLGILNEAIARTLKFELRAERHPDEPDAPADRE